MHHLEICLLNVASCRERREHKVFLELLRCVPGLEERLMNAESEEGVQSIAVMVRSSYSLFHGLTFIIADFSCRGELPVLDLTIQRV